MQLSDGNIIYVDLCLLSVQSKLIEEILKTYDQSNDTEHKEIIYQGDIDTYKYVYKVCEDQEHKLDDYIRKNFNKLNGSKIIIAMDYLQMPMDWIKNNVLPELAVWKNLTWTLPLPEPYIESFIPKVVSLDITRPLSRHSKITICIQRAYYHIIETYELHQRLMAYIIKQHEEYDTKILSI